MDQRDNHNTADSPQPMDITGPALKSSRRSRAKPLAFRVEVPFPIGSLPDLVHENIMSKLTFKDLISAGLVNRRWLANCNQVLRGITTLAIGCEWGMQSLCPVKEHKFEPFTCLPIEENLELICNLVSRMPKLVAFYMSSDSSKVKTSDSFGKLLEVLSRCLELEHLQLPDFNILTFDSSKFSKLTCMSDMQFAECANLKYGRVNESSSFYRTLMENFRGRQQLALLSSKLKWLSCSFSSNTNQIFETIVANGTNLENLEIYNSEATDDVSQICEKLTNLKMLRVEGSKTRLLGLKNLTKLESLRMLIVEDHHFLVSDVREILEPIGHRLWRLEIDLVFRKLSLATIIVIVETCPNLEVLELSPIVEQQDAFYDRAFTSIAKLSKLRYLGIYQLDCSDQIIVDLLKKLPSLKYFSCSMFIRKNIVYEDSRKDLSEMFERIRGEFPKIMFSIKKVYEDPAMKFVKSFRD